MSREDKESRIKSKIASYLEDGHLSEEEEYAISLASKQAGFSNGDLARMIADTATSLGVDRREAYRFHLKLWISSLSDIHF